MWKILGVLLSNRESLYFAQICGKAEHESHFDEPDVLRSGLYDSRLQNPIEWLIETHPSHFRSEESYPQLPREETIPGTSESKSRRALSVEAYH